MIKNTKQVWAVGEMVKVGFMHLRVMATQATPKDGMPDAYILANKNANKFYRFVPHNGIEGGFSSMKEALNFGF